MPLNAEPYTSFPGVELMGVNLDSRRSKQVINTNFFAMTQKTSFEDEAEFKRECKGKVGDFSQNTNMRRFSSEIIPTLIGSVSMFSYQEDRVFLNSDLMICQGRDLCDFSGLSPSAGRALASDAVHLQTMTLVIGSLLGAGAFDYVWQRD